MLNLQWNYGNLFCCIPSFLLTLHWALGTKNNEGARAVGMPFSYVKDRYSFFV
jgi:hypothetical protein